MYEHVRATRGGHPWEEGEKTEVQMRAPAVKAGGGAAGEMAALGRAGHPVDFRVSVAPPPLPEWRGCGWLGGRGENQCYAQKGGTEAR